MSNFHCASFPLLSELSRASFFTLLNLLLVEPLPFLPNSPVLHVTSPSAVYPQRKTFADYHLVVVLVNIYQMPSVGRQWGSAGLPRVRGNVKLSHSNSPHFRWKWLPRKIKKKERERERNYIRVSRYNDLWISSCLSCSVDEPFQKFISTS